jgi:hypothetical protein
MDGWIMQQHTMVLHSCFHQATGKMTNVLLSWNTLSEVGLFLALVSNTGGFPLGFDVSGNAHQNF